MTNMSTNTTVELSSHAREEIDELLTHFSCRSKKIGITWYA